MNSRSFTLLYRSARGEQNRTGQKERRCEFAKHDHILGETVWKWQVFRQFSTELENPRIVAHIPFIGSRIASHRPNSLHQDQAIAELLQTITKLSIPFAWNPTKWRQVRHP